MMTISLEQTAAGDWRVRLGQMTLFRALQLGPAIRIARAVARDEHQRLGRGVRVQMPGPTSEIVLACYADPVTPLLAVSQAA